MLREWQQEIIERLESGLNKYKVLALNAPTGSGKTIIALKLAERNAEMYTKIFFFTRTISQLTSPLRDLKKFGIQLTASILIGRERTCVFKSQWIRCSSCPYRSSKANIRLDTNIFKEIERELLQKRCVYLKLMELSKSAQMVILPFSYSRPSIAKRMGLEFDNSLLIFDEAHNILSFTTEYSFDIKSCIKAIRKLPIILDSLSTKFGISSVSNLIEVLPIQEVTMFLQRLLQISSENVIRVDFADMLSILKLYDLRPLEDLLSFLTLRNISVTELNLIHTLLSALKEAVEQNFSLYLKRNTLIIKQLLPWLKQINAKNIILMSGTMPSKEYLEKMLGEEIYYLSILDDEEIRGKYFETFPPNAIRYFIITDVSTKLTERFKSEVREAIERIEESTFLLSRRSQRIAIIVYPSYAYLKLSVPNLLSLSKRYDVELYVNEKGKGEYLLEEVKRVKGSAVIAAVAGDTLTEGVEVTDESGRSRIGIVALIGAPFPSPSLYIKDLAKTISKDRWKELEWKIYEEEMLMRVKQAIGRIRRSPQDSGIAILADSRFLRYIHRLAIDGNYEALESRELYLIINRGGSIH